MAVNTDAVLALTVVSADEVVWEGEATGVVARTTEGDIGILPNHEPLLAALVPCVVEITAVDGSREYVVVDGGFVSVADNRVSLLSQAARRAQDIDAGEAKRDLDAAHQAIDGGDASESTLRERDLALAELRAVEKVNGRA